LFSKIHEQVLIFIARMEEEALTDKQAAAKSNAGIMMLHCLL